MDISENLQIFMYTEKQILKNIILFYSLSATPTIRGALCIVNIEI